jgi:hypothetical protein
MFQVYTPSRRTVGTYRQVKFALSSNDSTVSLDVNVPPELAVLAEQLLPIPSPLSRILTKTPIKTELVTSAPKPIEQGTHSPMPEAFGHDPPTAQILPRPELSSLQSLQRSLDELQLLQEHTFPHGSTSSSPLSDIHTPELTSTDESHRPNRDCNPPERYGFPRGSAHLLYEPNTYQEAMNSLDADKWIAAMQVEHQAMIDANVWDILDINDLPPERKGIGSRWVYKIKLNSDSSIECFKARLVVKGYYQISGIDYEETFVLVTRYDSFRLILALAAHHNLELAQADVKSAFLHCNLKEDIWMLPPPGIGLSGKILRLKKSLYGLKQAPNEWYDKLSSVLVEKGFIATHFDPCVFICLTTPTILVVYVDDITAAGTCENINDIFSFLSTHFDLTVKDQLQWILGMEIQQTETAITLS